MYDNIYKPLKRTIFNITDDLHDTVMYMIRLCTRYGMYMIRLCTWYAHTDDTAGLTILSSTHQNESTSDKYGNRAALYLADSVNDHCISCMFIAWKPAWQSVQCEVLLFKPSIDFLLSYILWKMWTLFIKQSVNFRRSKAAYLKHL